MIWESLLELCGEKGSYDFSAKAKVNSTCRIKLTLLEDKIALIILTRARVRLSTDLASQFIFSFHAAPG